MSSTVHSKTHPSKMMDYGEDQEIAQKFVKQLRRDPDYLISRTGSFIIHPGYRTLCSLPPEHREVYMTKHDNPPETFGELADAVEQMTPIGKAAVACAKIVLEQKGVLTKNRV